MGNFHARRGLGLMTAAWAKAGGWVNPYVTNGLVAMWDGEWNGGTVGVHLDSLSTWKDIVGGLEYSGIPINVTGNALYFNGPSTNNGLTCQFNAPQNFTIELAFRTEKQSWSYSTPFGYVYDTMRDRRVQVNCDTRDLRLHVIYSSTKTISTKIADVSDMFGTIAIVKSGSSYSFYFNSANYGSVSESSLVLNRLFLGIRRNNAANEAFKGFIYGNRIYDRVLSSAEIDKNYEVDKARFDLT